MPLPRAVTVDGPAGSGKSTVCFAVARDLHYLFVDTGAFYRMITLAAVDQGIADADEAHIVALARRLHMDLSPALDADGRQYTALLDQRDVTPDIRTPRVEQHVSRISAMPAVRQIVNDLQRHVGRRGNVIMAGRDIGTVVLPDADLKIYLDASPEARGARRYHQLIAAGRNADLPSVIEDLRARDKYDSSRAIAPLRRAPDAVYIDSSGLNEDEVVELVKRFIVEWKPTPQQVIGS
jgi:CMP/dCMP kinase